MSKHAVVCIILKSVALDILFTVVPPFDPRLTACLLLQYKTGRCEETDWGLFFWGTFYAALTEHLRV